MTFTFVHVLTFDTVIPSELAPNAAEVDLLETLSTSNMSYSAKFEFGISTSNHHQQTNTQFLQAGCPSCRSTERMIDWLIDWLIDW